MEVWQRWILVAVCPWLSRLNNVDAVFYTFPQRYNLSIYIYIYELVVSFTHNFLFMAHVMWCQCQPCQCSCASASKHVVHVYSSIRIKQSDQKIHQHIHLFIACAFSLAMVLSKCIASTAGKMLWTHWLRSCGATRCEERLPWVDDMSCACRSGHGGPAKIWPWDVNLNHRFLLKGFMHI